MYRSKITILCKWIKFLNLDALYKCVNKLKMHGELRKELIIGTIVVNDTRQLNYIHNLSYFNMCN